MNYREVTILAKKSVGDSGTETIDLEIRDPITELTVYYEQDNHDAAVLNYPAERSISKIEIVDGGKTLFSLNGSEAMGVAVGERGKWPFVFYNETANQNFWSFIPIQFGRFLGDTEFGFDATKLRNPQLKITYSKQSTHETLLNEIAIYAKIMEGVPSPPQSLLWRAIRGYTSVANSTEETELPTDFPYRRLSIRPWGASLTLSGLVSNYKLACDVDKLTVFDLGWKAMYAMVLAQFGLYESRLKSEIGGSRALQTWLGVNLSCAVAPMTTNRIAKSYATFGNTISSEVHDLDGIDQTTACHVRATGFHPHSCVQYQFGDRDKPETWFRSSQYGTVKLILSHGANAAAMSIAVQQPVTLSP